MENSRRVRDTSTWYAIFRANARTTERRMTTERAKTRKRENNRNENGVVPHVWSRALTMSNREMNRRPTIPCLPGLEVI